MRLTYANVVATLALFLALSGGAAYAVGKIDSGDIAAGGVHTANLHKRAVTSGKLALGAVRSNQIATGSVGSDQIAAGAVRSAQIAAGAVGPGQIASAAIGSEQIGRAAVAPGNLQFPVSFLASPTAGSARLPTGGEATPYPISGGTWTQHPGGVNVLFGEGTATLAYDPTSGQSSCQAVIEIGLRGESEPAETGGGLQTESTTPVNVEANLGGLPLMDPASPIDRRLTAHIRSNGGCTEGSTIDSARFRVVDFG
jgi:hypothetical protein